MILRLLLSLALISAQAAPARAVSVNLVNPQVRASQEADALATVIDDFTLWVCSEYGHQIPCYAHVTNSGGQFNVWGYDGIIYNNGVSQNNLAHSNRGLAAFINNSNLALWTRDLSHSATWTVSNITASLNAIGVDGTVNSATTLTAGAANGTILQSITDATKTRIIQAYVQCITCTGNIQITIDNSTYTTLNSANCFDVNGVAQNLTTAGFSTCVIQQSTLANPTIGFKIVTNGDSIIVDAVNLFTGGSAIRTSPVFQTSSASSISGSLNAVQGFPNTLLNSTVGAVVFTNGLPATAQTFLGTGSTTQRILLGNTAQSVKFVANNVAITATLGGSGNFNTTIMKMGSSWTATGESVVGNNGTVATGANVYTPSSTNQLGTAAGSQTSEISGFIGRLVVFNFTPSDAQLQAMTTTP